MSIKKLSIPNTLGQKLSAVAHYPEKNSDRLAVICPGYLDTKDYDNFIKLADDLSKGGFIAVRFDPSGTWESEGTPENYNLTQYLKDVQSIIDFIKKESALKTICVLGHSLGGLVSLLYASEHKDISSVIGIMPPYSMIRPGKIRERDESSDWAKNGFAISKRDLPLQQKGKKEFRVPFSVIQDAYQYDILKVAQKITAPVLLIAGGIDTTIPKEDVQKIYTTLNEPKKIIILPNIGHNYRFNPEEILKVNREVINFLNAL